MPFIIKSLLMYEYIQGVITELSPAYAVIEAGGVGYHLTISLNTYSQLENGGKARLHTHFAVREDAQILYGFSSKEERETFRLLISVSGVGGNTARMILSTYSPAELSNIIATDNASLLKSVKGLGMKTAQKIIVELKDKLTGLGSSIGDSQLPLAGGEVYSEALAALSMLGFGRSASEKVVRAMMKDNPALPVEEIVRLSLKKM